MKQKYLSTSQKSPSRFVGTHWQPTPLPFCVPGAAQRRGQPALQRSIRLVRPHRAGPPRAAGASARAPSLLIDAGRKDKTIAPLTRGGIISNFKAMRTVRLSERSSGRAASRMLGSTSIRSAGAPACGAEKEIEGGIQRMWVWKKWNTGRKIWFWGRGGCGALAPAAQQLTRRLARLECTCRGSCSSGCRRSSPQTDRSRPFSGAASRPGKAATPAGRTWTPEPASAAVQGPVRRNASRGRSRSRSRSGGGRAAAAAAAARVAAAAAAVAAAAAAAAAADDARPEGAGQVRGVRATPAKRNKPSQRCP